jgi:hypothetical protein
LLWKKERTPVDKIWAAKFLSFHFHIQLMELLYQWQENWETPMKTITIGCKPRDTTYKPHSAEDIELLFKSFENESIHIPHDTDLHSLFFLTTQYNFHHHWSLWIRPQIIDLNLPYNLHEVRQF